MIKSILYGIVIVLSGLASMTDAIQKTFEVQGHRGARGLLPENTIPSFLKAVDLGVHTVEFDVVVSQDQRVVVSHEPWFHHRICSTPEGVPITEADQMNHLIYEMTYAEVARYDCGRRGHALFPEQQPMPVVKPLMQESIRAVDAHVAAQGWAPVRYNVELKSRPDWDDTLHPRPEVFARLVYDELQELNVLDRVIIQAFDVRTLQAMRALDDALTLALLVDNSLGIEANLERLGFMPEIYSPNFALLDREAVADLHARGMQVIPWTVNEVEDMRRLREMGVDGLITDYPDRAQFLLDGDRRRAPVDRR